MRTRMLKWLAITALVLAATWPSTTGYYVLLGFGACVATIWAIQAGHTGKHLREVAYMTASPRVKFEN
ncbi:MAG: hypothetical protein LAP13_06355 [Acidobacteriia bacterium]|nr:hypothetical protein [Terriglobia bacterium]